MGVMGEFVCFGLNKMSGDLPASGKVGFGLGKGIAGFVALVGLHFLEARSVFSS